MAEFLHEKIWAFELAKPNELIYKAKFQVSKQFFFTVETN